MCQYCGETDGCKATGKELRLSADLNAEDWKTIYWFYRRVVLPFLHGVVVQAQQRNKKEAQETRRTKLLT